MPDEPMALVERLRAPQYLRHHHMPNGDAILDTKRTLADMRAAADRIEVLQAFGRAAAEMIDKSGMALEEIIRIKDDMLGPRDEISSTPDQEAFDRGCRMAFYRCADIAKRAIMES